MWNKYQKRKMEILDRKSTDIALFFSTLDEILNTIEQALRNRTPHLNGEKFLSNLDLCRMLYISFHTLEDWRDNWKILFIQIKGKILYKELDMLKWLNQIIHTKKANSSDTQNQFIAIYL